MFYKLTGWQALEWEICWNECDYPFLFLFLKTYKWVNTMAWLCVTESTHSTHSLTCTWYIRVIEFKQRNTKSNSGSQHHNYKLSITQKNQLMSTCLRLKHKSYIQKNGYHLRVISHTSHIQNIQKGTIQVWHPYYSWACFSLSTPNSLQQSHPPHHQYLDPNKLHLYGCGVSHIRIGESVSSPPQY